MRCSARTPGERLPVSINELILTVLALLRIELHRHGVEVVTQLDASLPRVECDRVQVQQVILNLVMNAIEAMHEAPSRVLRIHDQPEQTLSGARVDRGYRIGNRPSQS